MAQLRPKTVDTAGSSDQDVAKVIDALGHFVNAKPQKSRHANPQTTDPTAAPTPDVEQLRREFLDETRLMKRVRFNASERLRKKHEAGELTFVLCGVFGFLVPFFTLLFSAELSELVTKVVTFTSLTIGLIAYGVTLHYQQQNFKDRAERFHVCGMQINNLRRSIKATKVTRLEQLKTFYGYYDQILRGCENHDDVDYELAKDKSRRSLLKLRLFVATYSLGPLIILIPSAIGFMIWYALK
ncbi:MAG: SLATT domain-containing protein [Pseudomonadota bacterium]